MITEFQCDDAITAVSVSPWMNRFLRLVQRKVMFMWVFRGEFIVVQANLC